MVRLLVAGRPKHAQQHPAWVGAQLVVVTLAEGARYGPVDTGREQLGFEQPSLEFQLYLRLVVALSPCRLSRSSQANRAHQLIPV